MGPLPMSSHAWFRVAAAAHIPSCRKEETSPHPSHLHAHPIGQNSITWPLQLQDRLGVTVFRQAVMSSGTAKEGKTDEGHMAVF